MSDELLTWRGKPIDSLTREEAIKALRECAALYREARDSHKATLDMWGACRQANKSVWPRYPDWLP